MSVNNAMDMAVQLEGTLGRFAQPFMALGLLSAGISSALWLSDQCLLRISRTF